MHAIHLESGNAKGDGKSKSHYVNRVNREVKGLNLEKKKKKTENTNKIMLSINDQMFSAVYAIAILMNYKVTACALL